MEAKLPEDRVLFASLLNSLIVALSNELFFSHDQTNSISEKENIAFMLLFRAWFWRLI